MLTHIASTMDFNRFLWLLESQAMLVNTRLSTKVCATDNNYETIPELVFNVDPCSDDYGGIRKSGIRMGGDVGACASFQDF